METAVRLFFILPFFFLLTDAADTTKLSTTSLAPQFHLRATGTYIFSKQLTRSEPKWQLPALKCLPCRIDAESSISGSKKSIPSEKRLAPCMSIYVYKVACMQVCVLS